jgi:hypothetical protein
VKISLGSATVNETRRMNELSLSIERLCPKFKHLPSKPQVIIEVF